jgi:hypothetical protein
MSLGEFTLKKTLAPSPLPKWERGEKISVFFLLPLSPKWERGLGGEGIFVRLINLT